MSKPRWYEIAEGEIGVTEDPDENIDNPRIVEYFTATDFMNRGDDEIPWCSAFANWCMVQAGIEGTHSARARSWHEEGWGEELDDPREGCLVVFKRPPNPASGHVGFFAGEKDDGRIRILGGNQGPDGRGAVSISNQSSDLVLSYRWPSPEMLAAADQPGPEKPARVEVKIRRPEFTAGLVKEYELLFAACRIREEKLPPVDAIVNKLSSQKSRYETVGNPLGIPWSMIAVIHNMECSCDFNCHLHNGDPLSDYTVHVPAGRPVTGSPRFPGRRAPRTHLPIRNSMSGRIGAWPASSINWSSTMAGATAKKGSPPPISGVSRITTLRASTSKMGCLTRRPSPNR